MLPVGAAWAAGVLAALTVLGMFGVLATQAESVPGAATTLSIYSARQEFLIAPLIARYQALTGVAVEAVFIKQGVLERLKAEGRNSPADLVLTTDVASLAAMVAAGVLQPVRSAVLEANVPARFRGEDGLWFGLTTRARAIFYARDRVDPSELSTYVDLTDAKWRGRICMRSGHHDYNRALLASMVAHDGEAAAEAWLRGLKANLARKPQGNERAQIRAIAEGVCDLALGNTYYMGKMKADPEQRAWAAAVAIFFPDQDGRGTHVNISGVAVTRSSDDPDAARAFVEFLSSDEAQRLYAEGNYEYPVKESVDLATEVASWGAFVVDAIPLREVARHQATAVRIVDRVGFDE
jgi:iron(III) transport system substrate-binding protein